MTHRQAVLTMLLVTLLWSMAGVVTRQVEQAQGLTLTFWRSAFNALALMVVLCALRSPSRVWAGLRSGRWALWASGLCWATMFTTFMWALTMTTVANVLVTMALGPLVTALLARWTLHQRLTWPSIMAMVVAGLGILLMQVPALMAQWNAHDAMQAVQEAPSARLAPASQEAGGAPVPVDSARHGLGFMLALAVPVGSALNWVLIRAAADREKSGDQRAPDFLLSVLIGAALSALAAGIVAQPLVVSAADLGWLALLGVFQLAIPCLLVVVAAKALQPSEVALLSLLEVVFGVAWAWMGTSEEPQAAVVIGGCTVLATLLAHEAWNLRRDRHSGPGP